MNVTLPLYKYREFSENNIFKICFMKTIKLFYYLNR